MTNEQYLIVSYFSAVVAGVLAAVGVGLFLIRPLRQILATIAGPLAKFFGRAFFAWLILLVLLAFTMISYFDCSHHSYNEIVTDYPHMVAVTHTQCQSMLLFLTFGIFSFAFGLGVLLALPWEKWKS